MFGFFGKKTKDNISDEERETLKLLKTSLDGLKKTLKSKEMLCACYLYKFIENNDLEAYQKFLFMMNEFTLEQKKMVFSYYENFPKANSKGKVLTKVNNERK